MKKCFNVEYDVVLSFAGEDRKYVEKVANFLKKSGVKVFYDFYEDINLWGKDLYQHLDDVYQNKAKYAVVFISEAYSKKLWTNHELKSAQARAFSENEEYVLPARFDDTEIPGIRRTIGYVSLRDLTPIQFAKKIIKKLGDIEPKDFLPDNIRYVKKAIQSIYRDFDDDEIEACVSYVFDRLKKTTEREKHFLATAVIHSCKHNIEEDFHEDITFIERMSGFNRSEVMEVLKSLTNLGFEYKIIKTEEGCEEDGNLQEYEKLSLKLISRMPSLILDNLTIILAIMYFGAIEGKCDSCGFKTLSRLDFSDLKDEPNDEQLEGILSCIPDGDESENDD
uniref:TIR protein n=1 Tax=Sphingobacterium sp. (strain 21) TaxID=743722 RepID=F4C9R2_SPHS2